MRPTVTEQLHHFGRILSTTVAPAVEDPYAADILRRLIADLRKLESCWDQAEDFMGWDIEQLEGLLAQIGPAAGRAPGCAIPQPALNCARAELDACTDNASVTAAERQQRLRAALAAEIPGLDRSPAGRDLLDGPVVGYFTERLARDPMANRRRTTTGHG